MPPAATAETTASEVQLAGVPVPTTRVGWEVSTAAPSAGTGADPPGLPAGGFVVPGRPDPVGGAGGDVVGVVVTGGGAAVVVAWPGGVGAAVVVVGLTVIGGPALPGPPAALQPTSRPAAPTATTAVRTESDLPDFVRICRTLTRLRATFVGHFDQQSH